MNLQEFILNDVNSSEFGCLLVNTNPKQYGLVFNDLITLKSKRKNNVKCDNIINNFISVFTDFNHIVNSFNYEDNEEKEIILEKPMYFLNILGLNDFSFTKKKFQLNNKNSNISKEITEYFEKNYNIYSTEYVDQKTKQNIANIILNCLYIKNKNQNKKQLVYSIDNFYDFYQKNTIDRIAEWCMVYTPQQNPFQLKYVFKIDTITKNFLFVVGVNDEIIFDSIQQHFLYIKNKIKDFHSITLLFKDIISNNKNIMLDIKNLGIDDQQFIDETLHFNEKYYYYKYNPILSDDSNIPMNSIKCLSNIIYNHRQLIRNLYFIITFTKYLEYFIKNFYNNIKVYDIQHLNDIKEIDIQKLYEEHYKKIYDYVYNLFSFDKTIFNYNEEIKDILENIVNKYNIV